MSLQFLLNLVAINSYLSSDVMFLFRPAIAGN